MTGASAAPSRFDDDPVAGADPWRLADMIPVGLAPDTWAALQKTDRLRGRLGSWLCHHLAVGPCDPSLFTRPEHRLALLDGAGLLQAANHAGAAWHARSLKAVVFGEVRAGLLAAIGEGAYAFALAESRLPLVPASDGPAPAELPAAILRDGTLCLASWLVDAPPALALRARLKAPAALDLRSAPEPIHRRHAGAILARVADRLVPDVRA